MRGDGFVESNGGRCHARVNTTRQCEVERNLGFVEASRSVRHPMFIDQLVDRAHAALLTLCTGVGRDHVRSLLSV
jgi:hypothetical protein